MSLISKYEKRRSSVYKLSLKTDVHSNTSSTLQKSRRLSVIKLPESAMTLRPLAVQSCILLNKRPIDVEYGSLFIALENGFIQIYSQHRLGGFMEQFNAVHMAGDCVTCMTTDKENEFLITATFLGYIKIWLISNYW